MDTLKEKYWTIYRLTNPNNEDYIGCSANIKSRFGNYKTLNGKTKEQRLLYQSLLDFGFDNHIVTILDTFRSDKIYSEGKELFWIRSFMCNRNKWPQTNGLNLTNGGQAPSGSVKSEETKRKIGDSNRGKIISNEHREMIRAAFKIKPPVGMRGKIHSEETKKKMSDKKKGMVSNFKGRKHTEESNLKNRMAHLGERGENHKKI